MDVKFYLDLFKKSLGGLDKNMLAQKRLEANVGIVLDSIYLKLYKREWTNDYDSPLNAEARIFFSIWLNDKTINDKKLFYNIHALKLRKLKGYKIASREFAARFRKHFKPYQHNWENVNVNLGPLTLMEGWTELKPEHLEKKIVSLANNFSSIDFLIDNSLKTFEVNQK